MKKEIVMFLLVLCSIGLVSAAEPNIQFRGVSYTDSLDNPIPLANDIGDKIIVDAYVIDYDGYEDLKKTWLKYKTYNVDCVARENKTSLVNLICTATVEADMIGTTQIYLRVREMDDSLTTKELPYSPFDFQSTPPTPIIPTQWAHGFKVKEREKYGEFEFPETKDYYYAKVGISVGGILGTNKIKRSSTLIIVKTKENERITIKTNQRDKPTVYNLSDTEVMVEQRASVRHVYYTKYNKTYSSGKVVERKKRNYDKGYTTLTYVIHPEDRNVSITMDFNGKDFKLEMEDIQFKKQVYQNGVSGRKVWVKY